MHGISLCFAFIMALFLYKCSRFVSQLGTLYPMFGNAPWRNITCASISLHHSVAYTLSYSLSCRISTTNGNLTKVNNKMMKNMNMKEKNVQK